MNPVLNVSRRSVLLGLGSGLVLSVGLGGPLRAAAQAGAPAEAPPMNPLQVFVAIAPDGQVTVTCHRAEMGQQVRTSMAQLICEELEADWSRVRVVQAGADPKYGDQNTDGSQSVRRNFLRLRQAGAAARTMLERAAAQTWGVRSSECRGMNHTVVHVPTGRRLGFGELAERAAGLAPPQIKAEQLKPRSQWKLIGQSVPGVDLLAMVTGAAQFGADVVLPGMLYAVIARPPSPFGKQVGYDRAAALAVAGVVDVVEMPVPAPPALFKPLGGVAVVARDFESAIRGRDALAVQWDSGPNGGYDSTAHQAELLQRLGKPGVAMRRDGDPDRILAGAQKVIRADYVTPYLAHAPIETPCAVARMLPNGGAEIWAPVQSPQNVQGSAARTLGLPREEISKVQVNVTLLGGAFGRKAQTDFVNEAVLIAKKLGDRPVKLMWTRGDDIRHAYYHPLSCQRLEAAVGTNGKVQAWRHRSAFTSITSIFEAGPAKPADWEMSQGVIDVPFAIPNIAGEAIPAQPGVRIGWLRSVCSVFHVFAVNSFVDELAHELGRDPLDMYLDLLGPPRRVRPTIVGEAKYGNYDEDQDSYPIDTARIANIVQRAAAMADWRRPRPKGVGLGMAAHRSSGSYVATVVEVDARSGQLVIPAIHVAMDAGTMVNPDHVRAQCEGGTIYGLSCALGEITIKDGRVQQSNLEDYSVCRMNQAPRRLEVHLERNEHPAGGVGEPPTPTVAPALCNAIFAATGRRIRRLPIGDQWRA